MLGLLRRDQLDDPTFSLGKGGLPLVCGDKNRHVAKACGRDVKDIEGPAPDDRCPQRHLERQLVKGNRVKARGEVLADPPALQPSPVHSPVFADHLRRAVAPRGSRDASWQRISPSGTSS